MRGGPAARLRSSSEAVAHFTSHASSPRRGTRASPVNARNPRPSRRAFGPPQDEGPPRGVARRKTQVLWCPRSLRNRGGRLAARHMRSKPMRSSRPEAGSASIKSACSLAASIRQRAPLQSRTACPGSNCQLLAGTPSGPGGSPDAARVSRCARNPQAPHPVPQSQRLARTPLQVDEVGGVYGRFWGWGYCGDRRRTKAGPDGKRAPVIPAP